MDIVFHAKERKMTLTKESEDWLYRDLPNSFFDNAGIFPKYKIFRNYRTKLWLNKKLGKIPEYWQALALTIYEMIRNRASSNCRAFRFQLFYAYKRLLDKGIDIHLPHYWYKDGVTIEPETIVRVTNGIIGWRCDESREECGITDTCRFYKKGE